MAALVRRFNLTPPRRLFSSAAEAPKSSKKEKKAPRISAIRGMHDLQPSAFQLQKFVMEKGSMAAEKFGFQHIATPLVEDTSLFLRSLGEDSDVVSKELYTWMQSKNSLSLRPEGTAGVLRSFISPSPMKFREQSESAMPQRVFYAGPMFRHERPQKGRYRQFSQLGVEWIGEGASGPSADIQILSMARVFLSSLGIEYKVKLNSIGTPQERHHYRQALVDFFRQDDSSLSETSRERLANGNVLRILDSKDLGDREMAAKAPSILDYLDQRSLKQLEQVQEGLSALQIPYEIDPKLMRGLDYYNDVIFEFYQPESSQLGRSQNTILAGGRYDGLARLLGGPENLPALGWAAGVERLCLLVDDSLLPTSIRPVCIVLAREDNPEKDWALELHALQLAQELMDIDGVQVVMGGDGPAGKQFMRANRHQAIAAVVIGSTEMEGKFVNVKWLDERREEAVPVTQLPSLIRTLTRPST